MVMEYEFSNGGHGRGGPAQGPSGPSSQSFNGSRTPRKRDAYIAVMGVTGAGKSSFIEKCSGKPVPIGHKLEACTATTDIYAYDAPDRTIYLIDTPGFDDTHRTDADVLREISTWLVDSYKKNILLDGIIYLHRINGNRMHGSARRNLMTFRKLCGPDALKKVILVTTMWDLVKKEEGEARETELLGMQDFWGWMMEKGSSFDRHYNTEQSAQKIVLELAHRSTKGVVVDLQRQLVDEKRTLGETSAGREVESELLKQKERWKQERREIEEDLQAAIQRRDLEAEEVMRAEREKNAREIRRVDEQMLGLRSTIETLLARGHDRDDRMARVERQLRAQETSNRDTLRRLEEKILELGKINLATSQSTENTPESTRDTIPDPPGRPNGSAQHRMSASEPAVPPISFDRSRVERAERADRGESDDAARGRTRPPPTAARPMRPESRRDERAHWWQSQPATRRTSREPEPEKPRRLSQSRRSDSIGVSSRRKSYTPEHTRNGSASERETKETKPYQLSYHDPTPTPSVTMWGDLVCVYKSQSVGSTTEPKLDMGSIYTQAVSFGDNVGGERVWIARYSDHTWKISPNLLEQYPKLGDRIDEKGLDNLRLCVLGPNQYYLASWHSGQWSCNAPDEFRRLLYKSGSKIAAAAFGRDGSYILSIRDDAQSHKLRFIKELNGYYRQLNDFLRENPKLSIHAVALDPSSTTDFILIYRKHHSFSSVRVLYRCSDQTKSKLLSEYLGT